MNRWGVIACVFSLSVGCIVGYAAHESTLRFDHALEVDDLKSEIGLQKKLLADCKGSVNHATVHQN